MVNGVVRDIALFSNAQKQQLLFMNNGYPALYSINKIENSFLYQAGV